ncbi:MULTISPECIES: MarR family winged helix-turn-helix transcriptional regulator [Kordiimonas]|uniref:MarR family winged helix-turn-helix transcriptional regulator n=1 Tax=Kordiimonas TaxID=288021 RepID=UPI001FF4536C|nr:MULTISPECIES: MarR family winged helix-turn-helix transcriptional regulator [Kordiimonas]MCK0069759.1 MarR family winged helix-turn-helix transcriptional regulator [Kordiimonas laminariae]UTW57225.1 winged helix-turn-helix transcriptional regulator [Kordiimonas sp. SCSIO 12603]
MEKKQNGALYLGEFLPYRLSVLSNRISQGIAAQYEERFQLSLPEWRVMAVVGEEPELSAGQVADRTAMDKVAVSRAVNKLIDAGRLERKFSPEDKRRSVLTLSDSGIEIYKQVVPIALNYEADIIEKLSDNEFNTLNSLLMKLEAIQLKT